jgi:hypothetical protein
MSTRIKGSGSISAVVKYYERHARQNGKTLDGKIHHAHCMECKQCGKRFQVYHYYRCRWTAIKFCSTDCYWAYRREAQKIAAVRKKDEAALRQHLYSISPIL